MTRGVWGSLFRFTTIYSEVVERHHHFAYYEAAPRTVFPRRRAFLVPVHRTLSSLGAVTGLGIFHAPFETVQQVFIIQATSETRHCLMLYFLRPIVTVLDRIHGPYLLFDPRIYLIQHWQKKICEEEKRFDVFVTT
jgi:hypothetical protein